MKITNWIVYCDVYLTFGDGDGEVDVSIENDVYFQNSKGGGDFLWFWREKKNTTNKTLKKHLTSSWAALIHYREK